MKALHAVLPFVLTLLSLVRCEQAAQPPEGHTWLTVTSGTTRALFGVDLRTDGTALAVGEGGTILLSSDAGNKLRMSPHGFYAYSASDVVMVGTCGQGSDCRSTASVVSLTTLDVHSADACPAMMDVHPVGDSVAVAVGSCIMRSTNRGRGWSQTSRGGTSRLNGVDFLSTTDGVAVGNDATIEWTTDGGRTWRRERIAHTNALYDVSADPAGGSVIAVGAGGLILRTD